MKTTFIAFFLLAGTAVAQEALEEAMILNQEIQFLEERAASARPVTAIKEERAARGHDVNVQSLEEKYFGDDSDNVSVKTSGPRRRR
jgi:hypothetical protein